MTHRDDPAGARQPMNRFPLLAAALSFALPGLGQLYNGERAKGLTIVCITAGIAYGAVMAVAGPTAFRSTFTAVTLAIVYLFIWLPATLDAFQRARGTETALLSGRKRWYVILMLLTVGPMAIPLLWQSPRFSRTAKLVWTAAVILLALLGVLFLVVVGPALEQTLQDLQQTLSTLQ